MNTLKTGNDRRDRVYEDIKVHVYMTLRFSGHQLTWPGALPGPRARPPKVPSASARPSSVPHQTQASEPGDHNRATCGSPAEGIGAIPQAMRQAKWCERERIRGSLEGDSLGGRSGRSPDDAGTGASHYANDERLRGNVQPRGAPAHDGSKPGNSVRRYEVICCPFGFDAGQQIPARWDGNGRQQAYDGEHHDQLGK